MAERRFPDLEIESSLESFGGWLGWIGQGTEPSPGVAALAWMAEQGDDLPEELEELRDTLAAFGLGHTEGAVERVIGLERAFKELAEEVLPHLGGGNTAHVQRLELIVDSCVKYSGVFDTPE